MDSGAQIAITGGRGFLGWHLACRLRAVHGIEARLLGRDDFSSERRLRERLDGVDTIFHLAGINRAETEDDVERGNIALAELLATALSGVSSPIHVVYANSVQSGLDNAYGRGKRAAAEILNKALQDLGGSLADVMLPNLFGEHGRPGYNSFVATFADAVAHERQPTISGDREIPLLHAQRAAVELIDAAERRRSEACRPTGTPRRVSEVLSLLQEFHALYAGRGEIPDLSVPFSVDLFNTYRSYLFPGRYPIRTPVHSDQRGDLFETVRSHGGTGQAFVSTTVPGATRGDHYHLRKVERFFVLKGEAEIALRRLYSDEVVKFRVSGESPAFVDMPTMWVHNITNVGDSELVTMFWADQLLDLQNPDQYPERVEEIEP